MKINSFLRYGTIVLAVVGLAACSEGETQSAQPMPESATSSTPAPASPPPAPVAVQETHCDACGVVRSVTPITQAGSTSGVGAAIGAVAGGLAGNQVGGGSGQRIATVAGVIGGAVAGNTIERNRNAQVTYEVVIDMESGGQQVLVVPDATYVGPGTAVRVQDGNIILR